MPVPDYQALMLPLLEALADGGEHSMSEVRSRLAERLSLSVEDQQVLLPSGGQPVFANRVGWAKTYLERAGLVETVRRGVYRLTDEGRALLGTKPAQVNNEVLRRYPSFLAFTGRAETSEPEPASDASAEQTPRERVDRAWQNLRDEVRAELLAAVLKASPAFFEQLVVTLLVAMGYGGSAEDASRALAVGRSGDGGIDGIIKEDALGLDTIYVQAKRWQGNVGRPDVQAFVGSLEGMRARKGVFLTTSDFTREARDYVERIGKHVALIDGQALTALMFKHGVGVSTEAVYEVKRIDGDFFEDG